MANFTTATAITEKAMSDAPAAPSEPFKMPEANGEPLIDFVTMVRPDAVFEYETVGGVDFQKRVLPNAASYRDNANKYFEPNILVRKFTQRQHDKLWERIKATWKRIPYRRNPAYKPDGEQPEYLPAHDVNLGEFLLFCTPKEYLELQLKGHVAELETAAQADAFGDTKDDAYKAQAKELPMDKKKRG